MSKIQMCKCNHCWRKQNEKLQHYTEGNCRALIACCVRGLQVSTAPRALNLTLRQYQYFNISSIVQMRKLRLKQCSGFFQRAPARTQGDMEIKSMLLELHAFSAPSHPTWEHFWLFHIGRNWVETFQPLSLCVPDPRTITQIFLVSYFISKLVEQVQSQVMQTQLTESYTWDKQPSQETLRKKMNETPTQNILGSVLVELVWKLKMFKWW
jgi:hypothetical protein